MRHKNRTMRYASSWQSVLIPLISVMLAFLLLGPIMINSIQNFFYQQKAQDAALLAKSYANSLQTAIDAEYLLTKRLESTLTVAGVTVTKYTDAFNQEILSSMARNLDVDIIHVYNAEMVIQHSNSSMYVGWEAPVGHPVRKFHESDLQSYVEPIREDHLTKILYKYGYHRFADGRIVQVGILAQTINTLYSHFSPQHIIDQLSSESSSILLAYLDLAGKAVAATDRTFSGTTIDYSNAGLHIDSNRYTRYNWNNNSYLVFHLPIVIDGYRAGSLMLFYNLANSDQLVRTLAILIGITLLAFFLLFAGSLIKIYRKNKKILYIAFHDDLTSLANLRHFHTSVSLIGGTKLACMVLNPMNFKLVNMVYGYDRGDEILRQIGHSLTTLSKQYPNLHIYRFSDDRFLLTLQNYKDENELQQICTEVLGIKQKTKLFNSVELCLGISLSPGPRHDSIKLIKHASIALNATSAFNPIQFYNKHLEDQLLRKDHIEQEIRSVINGEKEILSLVYQPVYDANNNKIIYFEALARMQSSTLGTISPLEFISIAEQRHLITQSSHMPKQLDPDMFSASQAVA